MTDIENKLYENLKDKTVCSYELGSKSITFIVAGVLPELNEKITKENPTEDFIFKIKEKVEGFWFIKRETELAEHYVQKWLIEQHLPEDESQLLQFAKYVVGCTMMAVEQSK